MKKNSTVTVVRSELAEESRDRRSNAVSQTPSHDDHTVFPVARQLQNATLGEL